MIKFAVCDDEPEMAQALCAALTAYMQARRADGCCVRSFSDGRSLLECGDSFDVILSRFIQSQTEQPASPGAADMAEWRNCDGRFRCGWGG